MLNSNQTNSITLKDKISVKAGSRYTIAWSNHNETQMRKKKDPKTLKVKSHVKAGGIRWNHNEKQLRVKSHVKAG